MEAEMWTTVLEFQFLNLAHEISVEFDNIVEFVETKIEMLRIRDWGLTRKKIL